MISPSAVFEGELLDLQFPNSNSRSTKQDLRTHVSAIRRIRVFDDGILPGILVNVGRKALSYVPRKIISVWVVQKRNNIICAMFRGLNYRIQGHLFTSY